MLRCKDVMYKYKERNVVRHHHQNKCKHSLTWLVKRGLVGLFPPIFHQMGFVKCETRNGPHYSSVEGFWLERHQPTGLGETIIKEHILPVNSRTSARET